MECPRTAGIVAWDEHHQKLYFAITTAHSWDKPWTIYNYGLLTHRITRFTNTWAAGFGAAAVSVSGQYLAYVKVHHMSPAAGCGSITDVEVVDLWDRRMGRPSLVFSPSDNVFWINELKWSSHSTVEYIATAHRRDCVEVPGEQAINGEVDVAGLSFR